MTRGLNLPGTPRPTSACRGTPLLYFIFPLFWSLLNLNLIKNSVSITSGNNVVLVDKVNFALGRVKRANYPNKQIRAVSRKCSERLFLYFYFYDHEGNKFPLPHIRPKDPWAHAVPCTMGTGSLSLVLNDWGVALITHPHLAACCRETFTVTNYRKCKKESVNKWSE